MRLTASNVCNTVQDMQIGTQFASTAVSVRIGAVIKYFAY